MIRATQQITTGDVSKLVRLNNIYATELSHLSTQEFSGLIAESFYAKCTTDHSAFLIAFARSATYDSPNFIWFKNTTKRFIYVDRVVVDASAQGSGLAGGLYRDLLAAAIDGGFCCICCEVNVSPPNPSSDRFHEAQGFVEVGRADLPDRGKTVRYLKKDLA